MGPSPSPRSNKNTVQIAKIKLITKLRNVESHPISANNAGPVLRIWPLQDSLKRSEPQIKQKYCLDGKSLIN